MTRNTDAYRKIRNTFRFLLGNLADFDPEQHAVPADELKGLDAYTLRRTRDLADRLAAAYTAYEFPVVYHRVLNFCAVDLSSFYLNIVKDRLYCSHPESSERRATQTVLHHVTRTLATFLAPILAFTADEIWEQLPGDPEPSVHLALFERLDNVLDAAEDDQAWDRLLALREVVYRQLEQLRQAGQIGKSEEAEVVISGSSEQLDDDLERCRDDLAALLIVSSVRRKGEADAADAAEPVTAYPGITVSTGGLEAPTCARCWRRFESLVEDPALPDLCERCHGVTSRLVSEGRAEVVAE
jgi:isoleucyl-tRNA synthetase